MSPVSQTVSAPAISRYAPRLGPSIVRSPIQAHTTTVVNPMRYAMCAALVPGANTDTDPATAANTGTAAAGTRLMRCLSVHRVPAQDLRLSGGDEIAGRVGVEADLGDRLAPGLLDRQDHRAGEDHVDRGAAGHPEREDAVLELGLP